MRLNRWKLISCALLSFAAGSLLTARLMYLNQVKANSNRVFELRIYHTVPGKASALQAEFREKVTKIFAKHDLKAVGYWGPEDAPASSDTFIYILAHPSRDAAKQHWDAFRADPEFQEMMKSQQAPEAKLVEKVDSTYMDPTDFSPMK
ncbi:MAG: NIPSNAP family protein [Bryobacteraceae bacterium]